MSDSGISLPKRLAVSAGTVVMLMLAAYVLIAEPFTAAGTTLYAEFGRAGQGLSTISPVKVRGVDVGGIEKIELDDSGRARVTMKVDDGVRIPDTVIAAVEPASVFGPKFINLIPGAHEQAGPFLAGGTTIERTADARDLSDLLGDADAAVQAIDPTELSTVLSTLSRGLAGQGTRLSETIDNTGELLRVAHENRRNARVFLHDAANLTGALGDSGDQVTGLAGDANTLIADTAAGGQGRLGAFAEQISQVSGLVSHGLDKRGGQLGTAFRSGERATSVIYAQLGLAGDGIRGANILLPQYQDLIKLPGPDGKRYLGVQGYLPSNPCELILGICPAEGR